jgi:hypothetical protein
MRAELAGYPRVRGTWVLLAAIACAVFGANLMLIAAFGAPVPYMDQWDVEALELYTPYLNGTLSADHLLAAHLEHRIFFPRLLALLHLELAGEWMPRLEMIFNAVVHASAITVLAALVMPLVAPQRRLLFAAFVAFLFALPVGYENILWALPSHFYLMTLFALGTIACTAGAATFSLRWLVGLVLAVCSFFSLSSGAATVFLVAIVMSVQMVTGARARRGAEFVGLTVLVAVGIAMIVNTPKTLTPPPFELEVFIRGLITHATLPFFSGGVAAAAFVHGPTLWLAWHTIAARPPRDSQAWIALGIAGWIALEVVLIVYGRGTYMASRYLDIIILALPIGLIAALALADRLRETRVARVAVAAAALWVCVMVVGLAGFVQNISLPEARDWAAHGTQQVANVRAYLASNDAANISGKAPYDSPYPDPQRIIDTLAIADMRDIMPVEIRLPDTDLSGVHQRMLLRGALAGATASVVETLLLIAPVFIAVALGLFFAAGAGAVTRQRRSVA